MTSDCLRAVQSHLDGLSRAERARVVESLSSQLDELKDAGLDPTQVLGEPIVYARKLVTALADDTDLPRWTLAGVPVETRAPFSAEVLTAIPVSTLTAIRSAPAAPAAVVVPIRQGLAATWTDSAAH